MKKLCILLLVSLGLSEEIVVESVYLETPASTFESVITGLRYNPLVDLQGRNFNEAQSDVAIRGGIFDNTEFRVGGASLYDPQTGHYSAEIPIAPSMLGESEILTGLDQAVFGFQGVAGSVRYSLSKIVSGGEVRLGVGDRRLNSQSGDARHFAGNVGFQVSGAHSGMNGTEAGGESELFRGTARAQIRGDSSQTDLLYGHLDKDYSWPYLYALKELHDLVSSPGIESDHTKTDLVLLNHKDTYKGKSYLEASAWFRQLDDDYEFDVSRKGLFNAFEHKTKSSGVSFGGLHDEDKFFIKYHVLGNFDELESTALVFGPYMSRSGYTASILPGTRVSVSDSSELELYAGARYDDTNRTDSFVGALGGLALVRDGQRFFVEFSESSQAPNYTAIGSNPNGGLFRGNPNLRNLESSLTEVGVELEDGKTKSKFAAFYKDDKNLTDWTYDSSITPFASRSANNVDIETLGFEASANHKISSTVHTLLGYTYLHKDEDYKVEGVDASFYALNFPKHRVVAGLGVDLTEGLLWKVNGEFRRQFENILRSGEDKPVILSSSLTYQFNSGLSVEAVIDNILDEEFQEVPGVPGSGQIAAVYFGYRW